MGVCICMVGWVRRAGHGSCWQGWTHQALVAPRPAPPPPATSPVCHLYRLTYMAACTAWPCRYNKEALRLRIFYLLNQVGMGRYGSTSTLRRTVGGGPAPTWCDKQGQAAGWPATLANCPIAAG